MQLRATNLMRMTLFFCSVLAIGLLSSAAEAATISAPTDFIIAQGQTGSVPISGTTDASPSVVGVDVIVQYDSSVIELTGTPITQLGYATAGWSIAHNVFVVSGTVKEIRISAATDGAVLQPPLPASATSELFTLNFQAVSTLTPMSSALTLTLTDFNEDPVTVVNGSVKLGGVTGALTLSPSPVRPSRDVTVILNDVDLNVNSGSAEMVNVTINSRATSGGTIKETQTVSLTETGAATGYFIGVFTTTYGVTGTVGGAFEVIPGDVLDGLYTDGFDASGDSGTAVTDEIDVVGGTNGSVATTPSSITMGNPLTVTVTDADIDDAGAPDAIVQISVVRFTAGAMTVVDTETIMVGSSGVGVNISTLGTPGVAGDGMLNVQAGDQLVAKYDDLIGSTGAPVPGNLSITQTSGSFTVPSTIEVTNDLVFTLTDADIGDGSRINGTSTVNVTVKNTTTSETETINGSSSDGTFNFTIPTAFSAAADPNDNGTLGVKPGDVLVVDYTDLRDAAGGSTLITSSNIIVDTGVDGTVTTAPSTVAIGGSVTVTVDDADLIGLGTLTVDVIVRRAGGNVETETIVLTESPANSGIFIAVVPTATSPGPQGDGTLNILAGDQIIVDYDDAIGSGGTPVDDVLSITPTDGGFNSVPATIQVANVLAISLTDLDISEPTRVNGAGSLTVTVRNNTTGETEDVVLGENPAGSGTFTGSLSTAFAGGTSTSNNGTLGTEVGDQVVIEYSDDLGASGSPTIITSSTINVVGGGDGIASLAPTPTFSVGATPLTITVQDADLGNSGSVGVTIRSIRNGNTIETETLTLNATGSSNQFTGTISSAFASGATSGSGGVIADNGIVELKAGDQVRAEYIDAVTSGGGSATVLSNASTAAGGTTGSIIASRLIQGGDGLRIQVTDADLNTNISSAEMASATVTNNDNGDVEMVTLLETGPNTGVFQATPPAITASGSASVGDGTVQLSAHDDITVSYADAFNDNGGLQVISTSVLGVLFGDTSDNNKLGAFDAAQILKNSVLFTTFSSYQSAVGNVDGSLHDNMWDPTRSITPYDASLVLQRVVGLISVFPIQGGIPDPHPYKKSVDRRLLAFGEAVQIGNSLKVPILLDETRDVRSGMIELSYDPTQYRVSSVKTAEASKDYLISSAIEGGSVRVALAGAQAKHTGEGAIIEVELEAIGAATGRAPLALQMASFNGGRIQAVAIDKSSMANAPLDFSLAPNFPNPFNPETTLRYALPQSGEVKLVIYDMLGQEVRTLVHEMQAPGVYTVLWNGHNEHGFAVASGLYFYRIEAGNFVQTRKMTLVR
ncbi:MAG: T9SS type A sorting domain-containing protein [Gemmatimonadetes bacterium]|nr:T9SS type A sorting domain-containing protein [Gemmatimonadota bacterium]